MNDWFDAEQKVERAQQLSEAHRWDDALREIDAALAINPHNGPWHAHRGQILDELERFGDAVEAFEHALTYTPGDRDVLTMLGVELTRLGHFARALEVFEELARLYPDYEPAYCHRIGVYVELGRHDQAEQMFYLAQELDESCPHCFYHIGASLAARGETDRALYCWQRVLTLDPDYLGVRQRIAGAFAAQGNLDSAKEHLLEELRGDPGNTDLLCQLAELAMQSGQVTAAAAKFAQVIELDPEHGPAQVALGRIHLRDGQAAEALRCFEHADQCALDLDDNLDVLIAEALLKLGRLAEAQKRLEAAADVDPACEPVLVLLAQCLLMGNRVDRAADCYRRVLAANADNAPAHHNLGVCCFKMRDFEAGVRHCLDAIACRPDYMLAIRKAALGHLHLGQWELARSMIRKGLRLDQDDGVLTMLAARMWRYRLRHYAKRLLMLLRPRSGR